MVNKYREILFSIKDLFSTTEFIEITIKANKKDIDNFNTKIDEDVKFTTIIVSNTDGIILNEEKGIKYNRLTIPMIGSIKFIENGK